MESSAIIRCECPIEAEDILTSSWYRPQEYKAMVHKPNECLGDYELKLYNRRGKMLYLCSCCNMAGDIEVEDLP